jgi:hypothetical protein
VQGTFTLWKIIAQFFTGHKKFICTFKLFIKLAKGVQCMLMQGTHTQHKTFGVQWFMGLLVSKPIFSSVDKDVLRKPNRFILPNVRINNSRITFLTM